ncbi:MAG: chorismate synthase [Clostridia bacterium]|nr:chorismate synthase [Clostridia bacterium]
MKNSFGSSVTVTLFGESHGEAIGAVIDGIGSGIKIDLEYINARLEQRKPYGSISTARVEADEVRFLSGVYNGYTTGTPLALIIENKNVKSGDYKAFEDIPRPSHADYTAEVKYGGFQDKRGGGHFSGRITAPLVAVGAILSRALENKGIKIGTHIKSLYKIADEGEILTPRDIDYLNSVKFPTLSKECGEKMTAEIERAAALGDSVGGVLETAVLGIPAGIGEPFFDSAESMLSHIIFSIPGVKGVEFGDGFAIADKLGSEANDELYLDNGTVKTYTNNSGGIQGGITNGMPIVIRTAIKPTPSIFKEQRSVNLKSGEAAILKLSGRHDPAIIHRVRAVIDAAVAIAIADLLTAKYGTDFFTK